MKKRLIFHWFIPNKETDGVFSNTNKRIPTDINKFECLHLNCLRHYAKMFDCATFVIAREKGVGDDIVSLVEKCIIDCGFFDVRFIVVENDAYLGECPMWKKLVIENEENFQGLTFYYQTKGITHDFSNSMVDWATALYFFNLNYIDEIETALTNEDTKFMCSGAFLCKGNDDPNPNYKVDYHYIYSGNAYWINSDRLKTWYTITKTSPSDYPIENRWSAEAYFSHTFPIILAHSIGEVVQQWDDYKDCIGHIFSTFDDEKIKSYCDFKYNIALKGIAL